MLRKLLIVSAIFIISSSIANAATYKVAPQPNYGSTDYKNENLSTNGSCCAAFATGNGTYVALSLGERNNYASGSNTYKGLDLNGAIGYGIVLVGNFYLGGELFGLRTVTLKDYAPSSTSVASKWGMGLSVLPGFVISDRVLAYARIGYIRQRFNNQNSYSSGGQIGLGAEATVAACWDVRAEYVYTLGEGLSGIGKPQSDVVNVGLVFRFA